MTKTRGNPDGFIYIVRRPSDGWYLGRGRWVEDALEARAFGNVGHAKLALQSRARRGRGWNVSDPSPHFEIVPCEIHPRFSLASVYVVPA